MYHVALDLDQEAKKQLKTLAASEGVTVKELITALVLARLNPDGSGSKSSKSKKATK